MTMKKLKKAICSFAIAGVVAVTSTVPAFAAPISTFPEQSTSSYAKSYTRMLQVMLMAYNTYSYDYINQAGGADGVYGNGTSSAVKVFQSSESISIDGICGKNTWARLASYPKYAWTESSYYYYTFKNSAVLRKVKTTDNWECKANGSWYYGG